MRYHECLLNKHSETMQNLVLLDQLVQQMNDWFGKTQAVAASLIHFVPSVISIHVNKSLEELT